VWHNGKPVLVKGFTEFGEREDQDDDDDDL